MFKFLIYVFLVQLVHWSVVRGIDPTAFSGVKDAVLGKLQAAASSTASDVTQTVTTCANAGDADSLATKCLDPLLAIIAESSDDAAAKSLKAAAANYFILDGLLLKTTATTDKMTIICEHLNKVKECFDDMTASSKPCESATALAAAAITKAKVQHPILYSMDTYCTGATAKAVFTDLFGTPNKYAACKVIDPAGVALEAALTAAVNQVQLLPSSADADAVAIIGDTASPTTASLKTIPLKNVCNGVQAAYNKLLLSYYQVKSKLTGTDCDDATLKLMFELIKIRTAPGTEKACTLTPLATIIPGTAPNPEDTTRQTVVVLGFQHVKYQRRVSGVDDYVSCNDPPSASSPMLLLEYGGVKIEGTFVLESSIPYLSAVKVTLKSGANTVTYEAPADAANLPTILKAGTTDAGTTFGTAYLMAENLKASITDPTTGLFIIINKVLTTADPQKGVYGVTVSAPVSVLDLLSGGTMYGGCTIALNSASSTGTLSAITTYDNGLLGGAGTMNAAITAAIAAAATTPVSPITTAAAPGSDSCFIKAGLPSLLFAAAIVKICLM